MIITQNFYGDRIYKSQELGLWIRERSLPFSTKWGLEVQIDNDWEYYSFDSFGAMRGFAESLIAEDAR